MNTLAPHILPPLELQGVPPSSLRRNFMGAPRWLMQAITVLVIAALLNVLAIPLVQAQQLKRQDKALTELARPQPAERYAKGFDQLQAALDATNTSAARISIFDQPVSPYATVLIRLEQEAQAIRDQWAQLHHTWEAAQIDGTILAHQQEIETHFEVKHAQLVALLRAAIDNPDQNHLAALQTFVDTQRPSNTHLPINLDNMPWQVEQPKHQMPSTMAIELEEKLHVNSRPVAQAAPLPQSFIAHHQTLATEQEPDIPAWSKAALDARLALKSASAATPADLAPTLDAPQTAEIQALAQSLDNNPHKIYQWVHDNIYWQPTQGSVQGAQNTLDKKAGNAIDTASLLIATLRSAGIPARYVYGSVEIPAAQVMNWVGGAQTTDAAQQILSQGGVPNVALVSGEQVRAIRLEHAWVEALIQYQPGRGAKHIQGVSTPDSWVPLDASFKQYTFQPGMDLQTAVPLDANALLDAAQQGATSNEQEGWVQHLNTAALQNQLSTYQSQLQSYIDSQNGGNSTVGDVLGQRTATIDPLPYLAGTLPYTVKARTQQFSEVPDSLRAKFKYGIYADARSAAWGDNPLMSFQAPTASLAGKKVTLAWVAASAADQAAIEALIPAGITDPSQLPKGLSNSIRLKPQILVEGQVKAEGPGMGAGSEPIGVGGFTKYGTNQWDETQDQLIAGQQTAMGLSIQGISQAQLDTLKTRMEATKAKLEQAQAAPEAQRPTILQDITGDHLTGDLLTATLWGYFAALQSHGVIAGSQAQMFDAPALSYGLFHAQVRPNKLYGIVTTGITFQGLNMDIGHLRHIRWVKDDNPASVINNKPELTQNGKPAAQNRWIAYNKMRGQYSSAMEHATPEQFWVDKNSCRYMDENGTIKNPAQADCAEGISAVKAIAIAKAKARRSTPSTRRIEPRPCPN